MIVLTVRYSAGTRRYRAAIAASDEALEAGRAADACEHRHRSEIAAFNCGHRIARQDFITYRCLCPLHNEGVVSG